MNNEELRDILIRRLRDEIKDKDSPYSNLKIKEMIKRLYDSDFVNKLSDYKSIITDKDFSLKKIEQNILGDLKNKKSTLLFQEEDANNAKAFYEALKDKYSKKQIAALMALSHQETAKGGNKYVKGKVWDPNKIQEGTKGGVVNRGLYSFEEGVGDFSNTPSNEKPTSYWYQDWVNTEEGSKYTNPYLSQTEFYINNYLTRTPNKREYKKIFDDPNASIKEIAEALHKAQNSQATNSSIVGDKAEFLYNLFPTDTELELQNKGWNMPQTNIYKDGGGLSRSKDYGSSKKPYPKVKSSDFAGKHRSYPIPTKADARDALRLAGLHGRSDIKAKVYKKYPSLKHTNGGELLGLDYYTNKLAMGGILDSPMVTRQIDTPVLKADAPNPQMTLKEQPISEKRFNSSDGSFNIDPSQTVSNVSTLFSGPNIVSQGMNQQAGVDEGDNYDPNYIDVSKVKKDFNTGQTLTSNVGAGSSIGATIGSIIPGAGTLAGAAIGAVGGAIVGGIKSIFGNKKAKRQERRAKEKARGLNTMTTMESYMGKAYGFADGGNLSNVMGRKYFADGGLTTFNNGGSHEESPIGGIPQGTDDNGNVNLVEEGETRFQDYIFSDRLTLDEDMVKELNLPSKLIDKTFAEASEILAKDIEEHPNDPISKRGFEEMMVRLQAANNMKKDIEDSNTFAEGGELNIEGNETKTLSNEEVEKQVESTSTKDLIKGGKATEEIKKEAPGLFNPLEISIGVKVEMEHSVNPTFAREIALDHLTEDPQYYTKLYNAGLVDEELSEEELQYIAQNSQSEQPSPEEQLINQPTEESVLNEPNEALNQEIPMEPQQFAEGGPLKGGYARNNPFGTAIYRKGLAHPFRRKPEVKVPDNYPMNYNGEYNVPNILGDSYILDEATVTAPKINKPHGYTTSSEYTRNNPFGTALYRKGWAHPFRKIQPVNEPMLMDPDVINQVSETPYTMWFREGFTPRDLYNPELDVSVASNPIEPQKLTTNFNSNKVINPTKISEVNSVKRKQEFDPYQLEADLEGNRIANENETSFDPTLDFKLTPEQLATLSPEDYQAYRRHERAMKLQGLGSLLQYTPVLGNLIGAASVGRAERVDPTYITPEQLNDYLQYNPIDPNTYTNPILGQAANTRRVMADLSGGSRASMLAGNLGINAQTQKAVSDAALQAEAINEQRRVQAAEFNRGTNQFNASERARAKQYNASAKTMTDDINARNRAARRTAIRGYLSGALQGLGSIGREQANRNIIKTMGLDYYLDALARVKYKG